MMSMMCYRGLLLWMLFAPTIQSFHNPLSSWKVSTAQNPFRQPTLTHAATTTSDGSTYIYNPTPDDLRRLKTDLVSCCTRPTKPSSVEVRNLVTELETVAEQIGVGQASSFSGLLSGEWELLFSPEDATRSSPFFWAFRKAFPENSDQIFSITDSIPAPIKEVGPAFQLIDLNTATQMGRFVSRVKVATLGGAAMSIMTTRGTIIRVEGIDGLRLKIETTKPEASTVLKTFLGPLGDVINENAPPFPSGAALERIRPGSSEVVMRTSFCDDGLRISRNDDNYDDVYVWRRRAFSSYEML